MSVSMDAKMRKFKAKTEMRLAALEMAAFGKVYETPKLNLIENIPEPEYKEVDVTDSSEAEGEPVTLPTEDQLKKRGRKKE